jgi:uncharacterized protein YgfB (UPF0149 family)
MSENPSSGIDKNAISYAELGSELARLHVGVGPSDLHGSLIGYLCAGGRTDAQHWLQALEIDTPPNAISHASLDRVFADCNAALDDPELRFEPLLPDDDAPIDARADALVSWCRGFLGGLGLGGGSGTTVSEDASEILRDLGTIAGSRFEYENAEEDESALAEVIEFVRVGVLLLHAEIGKPPRRDVTLH